MRKLRKISRLHNEAKSIFNEYIRRRDADRDGYNYCVTCPPGAKAIHYSKLHAGHFFHGKHWLSAMDERNVWPQCAGCNTYKHGNLIEYSEFLRRVFGPDIIDTLRELRHTGWKPSREELEQIIGAYKNKIIKLNNETP